MRKIVRIAKFKSQNLLKSLLYSENYHVDMAIFIIILF